MPVRNPVVQHGQLDHRKLRLGQDALLHGEKTRPHYLGTVIALNEQQKPLCPAAKASGDLLNPPLSLTEERC